MNQQVDTSSTSTETTPQQTEVDSNAAFERGFNKRRGTSAPEVKPSTEEVKVESAAEVSDPPETVATPEPDEWAGVSPKVKTEIESMRALLSGLEKVPEQLRTIHGHIGGLTGAQKEIKAALASAKTATESRGAETPTPEQVEIATKSAARWKQLAEDYPDWAEAVNERLTKVEAASKAPPPIDTAAIKTEITTDVDKRIAQSRANAVAEGRVLARIDLVHGDDWEERIKTPEFDAWMEKQPPAVQALGMSSKATDAIELLNKYAEHTKAIAKKAAEKADRDKRLESVIQPKGVTHTTTVVSDDDAFERGFKKGRTRGSV